MEPDKTDIEVMVRSASVALDTAMKKEKRNVKKQRSWKQRSNQRRGDNAFALPEDEVVLDSEHSWSSSGAKNHVIVSIDETKKGLRRTMRSNASSDRSTSDPSDVMSMATERVKNGRHRNSPPTHFAEPSTPKRRNSGRPTFTMDEQAPKKHTRSTSYVPSLQSPPSNVSQSSESAFLSGCDSETSNGRRSSRGKRSGGNKNFFKMLKRGMSGKKKKNKSVEVDWERDGKAPTGADDILKDLQRNSNVITTPPRSNRRVDKRSIQKAPSGGSNTSGSGGGGQTTEKKKLKLKVRNKQTKKEQQQAAAITAAATTAIVAASSRALVPLGGLSIQEEKKEDIADDEYTLYEVQNKPAFVLNKAIRYRRNAEKLLRDVVPASQIPNGNKTNNQLVVAVHVQPQGGMDARDAQAKARKAYKYANEARRLYKLLKDHREQTRYESQFQNGGVNPDESWEQIRARLLAENIPGGLSAPPVIEIGDEFAVQRVLSEESKMSDARSTFSERLELEEHQLKMNELSLFSTEFNFSFMAANSPSPGDNMSKDQYTRETISILQQFEDDELSVASPLSFASGDVSVLSNVTTKSEQDRREAHQKAMEELELFSGPSLRSSPLPGPPMLDTRTLSRTVSASIALLSDRVQSNYLELSEKGHELVYGGAESYSSDSEDDDDTHGLRNNVSTDASTGFSNVSGIQPAPSQDTGTAFSYTSQETGFGTGTSQTTGTSVGPTTLAKRFLMTRQVVPEKDKYALAPDGHDDDDDDDDDDDIGEDDTTVETGLEMSYDIHRFGIVRSAEESSSGSETDEETGSEYSDEFSDENDSCTFDDDDEEEDDEGYSSQYTDDPGTEGEDSTTLAGEEESTVYTDQEEEDEGSVASSRSSGEDDEGYSSGSFSESSQSLSTRAEERRRRISRRMRRLKQPKTMGEKFTAWVSALGTN